MKDFFSPQSVALIGASAKKGKIGNIIFENLLSSGVKIFPVNPNCQTIDNFNVYESVLSVPVSLDLAIIAIPAPLVPEALRQCIEKKIKYVIIISAGFSEVGPAGKILEEKITELVKGNEIFLLGPNCLGTINAKENFNASFAPKEVKSGKIGLIMQSGAMVTALLDIAQKEIFGFSKIATLGNKNQLDEVDFLEYFEKDKDTEIICLYLEEIRRGQKFLKTIRSISLKKPVLVMKAGSSSWAKTAIQSHTGALAGETFVAEQLIRQNGGLFFDNLFDLVGTLRLFSSFQSLKSNQILIVTNAGGPGVMATDLVEKNSLEMLSLTTKQKKMLRELLPEAASVNNPIDLLGDATADRYGQVLDLLTATIKKATILCLVTPQAQTPIGEIARIIVEISQKNHGRIIPVFMGGGAAEIAQKELAKNNLGNFAFPFQAIRSLKNFWKLEKTKDFLLEEGERKENRIFPPNLSRILAARKIFDKAKKENQKALFYFQGKELIEKYKISALPAHYLTSPEKALDLSMSYPVVAKIDSLSLLHKNAHDGLRLNILDAISLKKAIFELEKKFPQEKILVQQQVKAGTELIVGIKRDPAFGPVVILGMGGILAEIIDAKIIFSAFFEKGEIMKKIKDSIIGKILEKQKISLAEVAQAVEKVADLAVECSEIKELDLNPIIFYPDFFPIVVDVKVLLS